MTIYNRCTNCNGKKKMLGLGSIEKDCPSCKGIGYYESEVKVSEVGDILIDTEPKIVPKKPLSKREARVKRVLENPVISSR